MSLIEKVRSIIQLLKSDYALLSLCLLIGSILVDFFFLIYTLVLSFVASNYQYWYLGQLGWYSILIVARVILMIFFIKERRATPENKGKYNDFIELENPIFILLLGIEMFIISFLVYQYNLPMSSSSTLIIINGIYVTIKVCSAFFGVKYKKVEENQRVYCRNKKYLSRVENIFLFYLVFIKLIDLFGWISSILYKVSFFESGLISFITVISAIYLTIKNARRIRWVDRRDV